MVWDQLINKQLVYGDVMKSDWYHIGDINGLREIENLSNKNVSEEVIEKLVEII